MWTTKQSISEREQSLKTMDRFMKLQRWQLFNPMARYVALIALITQKNVWSKFITLSMRLSAGHRQSECLGLDSIFHALRRSGQVNNDIQRRVLPRDHPERRLRLANNCLLPVQERSFSVHSTRLWCLSLPAHCWWRQAGLLRVSYFFININHYICKTIIVTFIAEI